MTVIDKLATAVGARQKYSILGFELLNYDPVVAAARRAGFKVVEYDLPVYPIVTAGFQLLYMIGFIVGTSFAAWVLYHYVAHRSFVLKWGCIGGMATTMLAWPVIAGYSGCMMLDFWRPALGFRSALLVYDVFHLRRRDEVNSWNFARFLCALWAFPKEEDDIEERTILEGYKRNARWENIKGYPKVVFEGALFLLSLYMIPPLELTKHMSQLQYHIYCECLGFSILMALALFGDGLLKGMGVITNVEMQDMFESPLKCVNIRLFWSHWNRAIAAVFHRVIFRGGGRTPAQQKEKLKQAANKRVQQLAVKKRSHLDHLSETEAEHSKTDDEDERKRSGRSLQMSAVSGAKKEADKAAAAKSEKRSSSKSRSSFLPKAIAAVATFGMSGLFHEWITLYTFKIIDGRNFAFFILNGLATVASTWFRRSYPSINAKIPTVFAVLMLHSFFLLIGPLFCGAFIEGGFFIQMEALKYELMPWNAPTRGSFIYLFG